LGPKSDAMENNPDLKALPATKRQWLRFWEPSQLEEPQVDPDLRHLNQVQRSAEVLRYSILRTEYWISPHGTLREWLRLNVAIAMVLGIPSLLIVPVVTYLFNEFVTWSDLLVKIATNLAVLPGALLLAVGLFSALAFVIRRFLAS
jgi:hypothetical protein